MSLLSDNQRAALRPLLERMFHYAGEAPASDTGEGTWRDREDAYLCGHREEEASAAEIMRETLTAMGFKPPEGKPVCPGCSRLIADQMHDSDCTADEAGA